MILKHFTETTELPGVKTVIPRFFLTTYKNLELGTDFQTFCAAGGRWAMCFRNNTTCQIWPSDRELVKDGIPVKRTPWVTNQ